MKFTHTERKFIHLGAASIAIIAAGSIVSPLAGFALAVLLFAAATA